MSIVIVDYGMGNLRSVEKAVESVGGKVKVSADYHDINQASQLIVPGVGAFADCVRVLKEKSKFEAIRDFIHSGKPYLGICLGMQLLMENSFEFGTHEGMGIFKGNVVAFEKSPQHKVPHMGWNELHFKKSNRLFKGIAENSHVYFVHSFYVQTQDPNITSASCDYGIEFCAAIEKDNLFATQFHPEKSQKIGLKVLENFIKI